MRAFLKVLKAWVQAIPSLPAKWLYKPLKQGKHTQTPSIMDGEVTEEMKRTLEGLYPSSQCGHSGPE